MKAEITLTPAESKRLIAKSIVEMDAVRKARKKGIIAVCRGSSTAYVLEELQGSRVEIGRYTAGYVGARGLLVNPKVPTEIIFVDGKIRKGVALADILGDLRPGDVVIKGANAIGPDWIPGNLIAKSDPTTTGGTVGTFQITAMARGVGVIVPIGLEKFIPASVLTASKKLSTGQVDYAMGIPCTLIPLFGTVVTELEAIRMIAEIEVTPIAAGGIGGAEGSITLLVEGSEAQVNKVIRAVEAIKGEAPVQEPK